MRWRERDGVRWLSADVGGAEAAFTTRLGGVSDPPFDELNVGVLTGDEPEAVRENRMRIARALGRDPAGVLLAHQVHGAALQRHDARPSPNPFCAGEMRSPDEADGQLTSHPGLTPMVQVADCLPVAMAGPQGVAMVHCGWRGLAAGIVAQAAERVEASAAAIGPGIGACCYEVGDEVLASFAGLGEGISEGRMLDLAEVTRRLLAAAGVESVESAGLCTSCRPQLFFSHRRDGERAGRQAGLAWARADG